MEDERLAGSQLAGQAAMEQDRAAGHAKTKRTVDDILNAFRSSAAAGSSTDRSGGTA